MMPDEKTAFNRDDSARFFDCPCIWQYLEESPDPIVLYGMGDGADKVLRCLAERGIKPAGVFASDEFVRGQQFAGFTVEKYSDVKARLGDFAVLVCFGTERSEVIEHISAIAAEQQVLVPHVPLFGEALVDESFVTEHRDELLAADDIWADAESRRVYRAYFRALWSGELSVMRSVESSRADVWQILQPDADEVFVDLGAYDGDTVREFLGQTGGRCRRVWAFEPDAKNFRKLTAAMEGDERIRCLNMGVWQESGQLLFAGKAGRNSSLQFTAGGKGAMTDVISLDDWLTEYAVEPPTLLKFDVEGAEEAALLGAQRLLAEYKPKLQVAAYHRSEDFFRLPLLIKRLNPEYRLYLRHHPYIPAWETNIYAV